MTRAAIWLGALAFAACTQDFDAFEFEADGRSAQMSSTQRDDAGAGHTGDDAGIGQSHTDAGGAGAPMRADSDAGDTPAVDGGVDAAAPAAGSGGGPDDAGEPATDAGDSAPDAGSPDAGATDSACVTAWNTAPPATESCRDCACDACAETVVACLTHGPASERSLCQAVLACTTAQDCGEDCYCASHQCGVVVDVDGDGPCAAQMNAAAGGTRDAVDQILAANNPSEPLVRAMRAMDCLLGIDSRTAGSCEQACP